MYPSHSTNSVADMVRAERTWAGIAAVLLCYYGYNVALPGTTFAEGLFCYTLRIGGPALVLSVLLLQTGKLFALAYDGIISILIGVGLALSSVLWLMRGGGGFQTYLNIFFGILFFHAGWRNWNVWTQMRTVDLTAPRRPPEPVPRTTRHVPPSDSLSGRIKQHREQHAADQAPSEARPPAPTAQSEPSDPPTAQQAADAPPVTDAATESTPKPQTPTADDSAKSSSTLESMPPLTSSTEGFLASFADSDDDDKST